MANLKISLANTLKWEGGYSNDPRDFGKQTWRGVTLNTYKEYCRRKGKPVPTVDEFKMLTDSDILDIAKTLYWNKILGDKIKNQSIADLIFDMVWLSGLGYVRYIQRTLGVNSDGIFGTRTLDSLNTQTSPDLFDKLVRQRRAYLANCRSAQYHLKGWIRRLESFKYKQ